MSVKWCSLLLCCAFVSGAHAAVDLVKVDKSKRRMYLMDNGVTIKEYRIALGANPKGHKQERGDNRTPEGSYTLDYVFDDSAYYRSVHISYPDAIDRLEAHRQGVDPGGDIKIHGLKNGETQDPNFIQSFDWTNGCIAITNEEMDEFIKLVKMGTPIAIEW
ncbi:L,D-transpeptidase family protein [Vibrio mytili]|uniref:ErfK/YbiS/YcfS/YnhG family protein n=1 Tax=Vibrio mytili TaxID=50718 RepID=A0A0C3E6L1_9VIBR|nr:L,D-transpeptidase family protein [Vibrio mytili]KIN10038.1 ErfK/YbiS/YcfS/YnhG family protein [Vibrio mytili]